MTPFEEKKQATEFKNYQEFIITSIKMVGTNFSVDTDFSEYRISVNQIRFSPECSTGLNTRLKKAKALFTKMGENIYEFTQKHIQLIHKTQKV